MAEQEQKKLNILVICGDDIGSWNLSCYSRSMMGYQTLNIDRIALEDSFRGAPDAGHHADLGGAIRAVAVSEDVQPAD